jgi:hypothetical protein
MCWDCWASEHWAWIALAMLVLGLVLGHINMAIHSE